MALSKITRSLGDGTAWPIPGEGLSDLGWELRYADDETIRSRRLAAASVVDAYQALLALPVRERNKRARMIRKAAKAMAAEGATPGTRGTTTNE